MATDANWRADAPHLPLLDGVEFQPVFLLGDHRSGTTLLYRLLTNSGAFHSVTAYHLIRYERLLTDHLSGAAEESRRQLDALFHSLGLTTRRIDHTPLSADLPEEYGFFLLRATRRSKITRRNVSRFVEFCRNIQFISPGQRPLLLKNPWDYPNFLFLRAAFPTARFIFIHRDPYHVLNSQLKAARELLAEEDPYTSMLYEKYARIMRRAPARVFFRWYFSPPARRALRKLARGIAANACYYVRHIGELPAGAYVGVGYEELCRQPDETIRRILVFAQPCRRPVSPAHRKSRRGPCVCYPRWNAFVLGSRLSSRLNWRISAIAHESAQRPTIGLCEERAAEYHEGMVLISSSPEVRRSRYVRCALVGRSQAPKNIAQLAPPAMKIMALD